jgi:hypothetical protein
MKPAFLQNADIISINLYAKLVKIIDVFYGPQVLHSNEVLLYVKNT